MKFAPCFKSVLVIDRVPTGQNARAVRKELKMSLKTLSQKIGFSANYIRQLEVGQCAWSQKLVDLFSKHLS